MNIDRMIVIKRENSYLTNIANGRLLFSGTPKVAKRFENLQEVIDVLSDIENLNGCIITNNIFYLPLEDLGKLNFLYKEAMKKVDDEIAVKLIEILDYNENNFRLVYEVNGIETMTLISYSLQNKEANKLVKGIEETISSR